MNKNKLLLLFASVTLITACNSGGGGSSGGGSVITSNPPAFQQFYPNGSPLTPNNLGSTKSWSNGSGDLNFTFYGSANYGGISITLSGTVNLNNPTCAVLADSDGLATMTLTNCSQSTSNNTYVLTATATGGGSFGSGVSTLSITTPVLPSGTYTTPSNCSNIATSGTTLSATCLATNGYTTYNASANIASCPNGPVAWNATTHVLACS